MFIFLEYTPIKSRLQQASGGGSRPSAKGGGGGRFFWDVETKLICELFYYYYYFFCQNKGGARAPQAPPLDPPLACELLHNHQRRDFRLKLATIKSLVVFKHFWDLEFQNL